MLATDRMQRSSKNVPAELQQRCQWQTTLVSRERARDQIIDVALLMQQLAHLKQRASIQTIQSERHMLIIMACSEAKLDGRRAALDKYNTRQHRSLHHELWMEQALCSNIAMILSAEHGLIDINRSVADYDRKMDAARAAEFASDEEQLAIIREALSDELAQDIVAIYGGKLYRNTVKALLQRAGFDGEIIEIVGENRGCGDHYSALMQMFAAHSVDA